MRLGLKRQIGPPHRVRPYTHLGAWIRWQLGPTRRSLLVCALLPRVVARRARIVRHLPLSLLARLRRGRSWCASRMSLQRPADLALGTKTRCSPSVLHHCVPSSIPQLPLSCDAAVCSPWSTSKARAAVATPRATAAQHGSGKKVKYVNNKMVVWIENETPVTFYWPCTYLYRCLCTPSWIRERKSHNFSLIDIFSNRHLITC
jgi:hypothetical protein